jgi:hypothetical protein
MPTPCLDAVLIWAGLGIDADDVPRMQYEGHVADGALTALEHADNHCDRESVQGFGQFPDLWVVERPRTCPSR